LRFTGNTGNSIGGVTASSDSQRAFNDIPGKIFNGRYQNVETDTQNNQTLFLKVANRRTDYFRVEDTPTAAGSVLNSTNHFNDPDSTNPRQNFIDGGYVIVPIGSLFP
jgi:hypothetical protein